MLHFGAAQIEIAITQTDVFAGVGVVVELERRRQRRVQNLERAPEHFDFAGLHVGIDRAARPQPHASGDAQHVFVSDLVGGREAVFDVGVVDDLHDAAAIAHVEEDHAAVIAASMHPTTEFDFAIDMRCVEIATVVTAH